MSHAGWIKDSVNPERLELVSNFLAEEINKDKEELGINSIAVTGVSGLVIGGLISVKTNLPLVIVRKDDDRHSHHNVEFTDDLEELNYCIVDDLISSGDTLKRIVRQIENDKNSTHKSKQIKKIYLYKQFDDDLRGRDIIIELDVPVYSFYSDDRIIKYLFDNNPKKSILDVKRKSE